MVAEYKKGGPNNRMLLNGLRNCINGMKIRRAEKKQQRNVRKNRKIFRRNSFAHRALEKVCKYRNSFSG